MRGKQKQELQEVRNALAAFVDIETEPLPANVEEKFGPTEIAELVRLQTLGDVLEEMANIQRGFVWILIKRKLAHGNFKRFVEEQGRKYMTVWNWMCRARAYQRCGSVAKYIPQQALQHLLCLTEEQTYKITELCLGIPAEEAKKVTSEAIEVEYRKIQAEKQTGKHRKSDNRQPAELPTELELLTAKVIVALRQIEGLTIPKHEWELAKQRCKEIAIVWDHAAYNLYDPEHRSVPPWELGNSDDISTDEEEEVGDEAR